MIVSYYLHYFHQHVYPGFLDHGDKLLHLGALDLDRRDFGLKLFAHVEATGLDEAQGAVNGLKNDILGRGKADHP